MASSNTAFLCASCLEQHDNTTPIPIPDGSSLCEPCFLSGLKPRFIAATRSETDYPVRWGSHELNIHDYARYFTDGFLAVWDAKVFKYSIPAAERLYCAGTYDGDRCNEFLGKKGEDSQHDSLVECICGGRTCATCGEGFEGFYDDHHCDSKPATPEPEDPFVGLERGVAYQLCPKCFTSCELEDGCHHIVCQVPSCNRTNFCYKCGIETARDYSHWDPRKTENPCPLYPVQENAEPQYYGDEVEDDDEDDDENLDVEALREVHEQLIADEQQADRLNVIPANETREARIRRQDRQELIRICDALAAWFETHPDRAAFNRDVQLVIVNVRQLLSSYTYHQLGLNWPEYRRRVWMFDTTMELVDMVFRAIGGEMYGLFPGLRRIMSNIVRITRQLRRVFDQGIQEADLIAGVQEGDE